MKSQCDTIAHELQSQLSNLFAVTTVNGVCVVSTPFTLPDNRSIEIILEPQLSGTYLVSDDGVGHHYARMSGVSNRLLSQEESRAAERYGVNASAGEIIVESESTEIMEAIARVIHSSQLVADSVGFKKIGTLKSAFTRELETALVIRKRSYERNKLLPGGVKQIMVDYDVLATEMARQVLLFTVPANVNRQKADAIPFRIEQLQQQSRTSTLFGDIAVVYEDVTEDRGKIDDALRGIRSREVSLIPLSDQRALDQLLSDAA